MKLMICGAGIILVVASFSAVADEPSNANYGVSFSGTNQLLLRKVVNESVMVYGGIQVASYNLDGGNSSFLSSSATSRYYSIGVRDYLSKASLSKFINFEFTRGFQTSTDAVGTSQRVDTSAYLNYGIEYFLSPNISIEGSAGVAFYKYEITNSTYSHSFTNTAIPIAKLALTYYW